MDLVNLGVGVDFLDEVSRQLSPGKAAIVAEIEEEWVTPLDTRMEALGGTIYRRPRAEVIDVKMERDAALLQAELDKLKLTLGLPNVVHGPGHQVEFPSESRPLVAEFLTDFGPLSIAFGFVRNG